MKKSLLDMAVEAHGGGGIARWNQLKSLNVQFTAGGAIWPIKGWADVLVNINGALDTRHVHAEYWPYLQHGQKAVFEPTKTSIVAASGEVLESRKLPRQAFEGHKMTTPWDAQHLIYFAGYTMWTYLTTPFLFKLPKFKVEEVDPWNENGETWRGLKVTFPPEIPSHSTEQTFYFDSAGLLRRHDYSVEIMGGTSSANYAYEHKSFGGIVFPTKRRVYSKAPDGKPILDRIAVEIDINHIAVS